MQRRPTGKLEAGAAALYRPQERQQATGNAFIAAIVKAGASEEDVCIWPENWPVFRLFAALSSQWRVGMNGPTGLCYEALYPLLDRLTSTRREWDEMFDDIRVMERAALDAMKPDD